MLVCFCLRLFVFGFDKERMDERKLIVWLTHAHVCKQDFLLFIIKKRRTKKKRIDERKFLVLFVCFCLGFVVVVVEKRE